MKIQEVIPILVNNELGILVKNKNLDQFYTKPDIADICIKYCLDNFSDVFHKKINYLEPSAGTGSFIKALEKNKISRKNIFGYDLDPRDSNIIKNDYLKEEIKIFKEKDFNKSKIIVIGNPPFGNRSKIAIDFINQSLNYAETVAFILPNQFKKYSAQSKINDKLKLIGQLELPLNAFFTENKKDYKVGCVFQIWTTVKTTHKDKRIRISPPVTHDDFILYQYNNTKEARWTFDTDWDIAVFCQGYGDYDKIYTQKDKELLSFNKQYIFIKANNKKALSILKKIDYNRLSQDNTTIPGFRKNNLVSEYIRLKKEYL